MNITIVVEVTDPDYIDEDHDTGITAEAYESIVSNLLLGPVSGIVDIRKGDER